MERIKTKGWAADFSYLYYRKLLQTAQTNFEIYPVSRAIDLINLKGKRILFLRHDVDISISCALQMARIENELEIKSTYLVMLNSYLYRFDDSETKNMLRQILNLGHEIGLHYYSNSNLIEIKSQIYSACYKLEQITESPVLSISFHRPTPRLIGGPLKICNRINTYSKDLMGWYLSDSKGIWRDGNPLLKLQNPTKQILQLLVHPFWWGRKHQSASKRLRGFIDKKMHKKNFSERAEFLEKIKNTLPGVEIKS